MVVTGFLGSGKTTLINQLLARRATRPVTDGKLAVIVNELGEVGIDGALLGGSPTQVELPGGCVCCVLGDELDKTVIDIVNTNPGLAAIVLETTGVAEPLPIAWALTREPVNSMVRLAAVVTLVDAANFLASRPLSAAVDAQVAYADVILLTKEELGTDQAAVEAAVRALAPRAELRRGAHAAWLDALLDDPPIDDHRPGEPANHVHSDTCRHTDSAHGIDSCWVAVADPVDLEELEDQLAALPSNYVRIKGVVRTTDGWAVIHRVGLRVSSEPLTTVPRFVIGRLVALGTELDIDVLATAASRASDLLREEYTP